MLLLTATRETQGWAPGDFCDAIEGELVVVFVNCTDPGHDNWLIGCDGDCPRRFYGLNSHQVCTTAKIRDVPISPSDYKLAITAYAEQRGSPVPDAAGSFFAGHTIDVAALLLPGTVVGYGPKRLEVRARPRAGWTEVARMTSEFFRIPRRHRYYRRLLRQAASAAEHREG